MAINRMASRRQAEDWIARGLVLVNGQPAAIGQRIVPGRDQVSLDPSLETESGERMTIALHKPVGYETTTAGGQGSDRIVMDLVRDIPVRLFPVGRLDKDSSGLLLLTNDNRLAHDLTDPDSQCEKEYLVQVNRALTEGMLAKLRQGINLWGSRTRPATVEPLHDFRYRVVLVEGRNRQIRRMIRKVGSQVVSLCRTRIGRLELGNLPSGQWRRLSQPDLDRLR